MPTLDDLVLEHRGFVVADFAEVYGIRLHRVGNDAMTWAEFAELLTNLLATPRSRLWRHYAPKHDRRDDTTDEGGEL